MLTIEIKIRRIIITIIATKNKVEEQQGNQPFKEKRIRT